MRKLLILVFLMLTACGSHGPIMVDTITVSHDELQEMCNESPCSGHSEWGNYPEGQKWCIIYLMPYNEYGSEKSVKDMLYNLSYGHEMRHCRDGKWH